MAEHLKFTKFEVLEILLVKDEAKRTVLEKLKLVPKVHEAVGNEVSFQIQSFFQCSVKFKHGESGLG